MPPQEIEPPDGDYGWVVVFASACIQGLITGQIKSYGVIEVALVDVEKLTSANFAQWLIGVTSTLAYGLGPVAALLSNLFGFRKIAFFGGLLAGAGLCFSYFAYHIGVLFGTFGVVFALGASLSMVSASSIIPQYFKKRLTFAYSLVTVGSGISSIVMPLLSTVLLRRYGYTWTFLIYGGITFLICVCSFSLKSYEPPNVDDSDNSIVFPKNKLQLFAVMFETPENILQKTRKVSSASIQSITGRRKKRFHTSLLKEYRFIFYVFAVMCFRLNYGVVFNLLPLRISRLQQSQNSFDFNCYNCTDYDYYSDDIDDSQSMLVNGGTLLAIMSTTEVIFRLVWGALWSWQKLTKPRFRQVGFGVYLCLTGILTVLLVTLPVFKQSLALQCWAAVMGFLQSGNQPLLYTVANDIAGTQRAATSIGLLHLATSIIFLLGSGLTGFLIAFEETVQVVFLVGGGAAILGGIVSCLILLLPEKKKSYRKVDGSALIAFSLTGGGFLVGPFLTASRRTTRRSVSRREPHSNRESIVGSVLRKAIRTLSTQASQVVKSPEIIDIQNAKPGDIKGAHGLMDVREEEEEHAEHTENDIVDLDSEDLQGIYPTIKPIGVY